MGPSHASCQSHTAPQQQGGASCQSRHGPTLPDEGRPRSRSSGKTQNDGVPGPFLRPRVHLGRIGVRNSPRAKARRAEAQRARRGREVPVPQEG
eukprot:4133505-Pyramimonas_sp.AAC.4